MKFPRFLRLAALMVCAASVLFLSKKSLSSSSSSPKSPDPIAAEIAREIAVLESLPESDGMLKQLRDAGGPVLARAGEALGAGRRMLALQRLAAAYSNVVAAEYLRALPPASLGEVPAFEAEWARRGAELSAPRSGAAESLKPAAVRALAEAAIPQAKEFYDASLEYGRGTMPEAGLYYIGSARGQLAFLEFCRALDEPAGGAPLRLRSLAPDIDAFEKILLAAYKPSASIDRHAEFIAASASLKEAKELDAAGLRHGALLRFLHATLRFGSPSAAGPDAAEVARRLEEARAKLEADGLDHSIARIFLESARGDLESAAAKPGTAPSVAATIVSEVLPRYFVALGPAPRAAPRPDPVATITLVRWPYT